LTVDVLLGSRRLRWHNDLGQACSGVNQIRERIRAAKVASFDAVSDDLGCAIKTHHQVEQIDRSLFDEMLAGPAGSATRQILVVGARNFEALGSLARRLPG